MKVLKNLYLNNLFFYALLGIISLFVSAFFFPFLYYLTCCLLVILIAFFVLDILMLFFVKSGFDATRITPEKLSNGDENAINVSLKNYYTFPVKVKIIDEIPFQFQIRNFEINQKLKANSATAINYYLRPTERGEYFFGNLNVYVHSPFQLISRRFTFNKDTMVPTYPSYIQLRKYDLLAFSNNLFQY